jgi:hypothetical protein
MRLARLDPHDRARSPAPPQRGLTTGPGCSHPAERRALLPETRACRPGGARSPLVRPELRGAEGHG